ncbi:MAG: hypothetical protein KJP07_08015, partial [Desulfatitalea sp.]|nr:hypothetical protein [Desulfatitalea sp.]
MQIVVSVNLKASVNIKASVAFRASIVFMDSNDLEEDKKAYLGKVQPCNLNPQELNTGPIPPYSGQSWA